MRVVTFTLLALSAVRPVSAVTPEQIVRQSINNYLHDYRDAATHYTYMQRDVETGGSHEKDGSHEKVTVSKVLIVNGVPYERLVSLNGEPLSPSQSQKEQAKLDRRQNESSSESAKQLREYTIAPDFLQEVPNAFTFSLLPEETIEGRPNYVIECQPKATFHAHNSRAAMFSHITAKLWVDKQDLQWTKADARVQNTISIGWILARIGSGATISIKQKRLSDKDWLPSLIDINGDAKVLLVKNRPIHQQISYYDFKPLSGPASSVQARK